MISWEIEAGEGAVVFDRGGVVGAGGFDWAFVISERAINTVGAYSGLIFFKSFVPSNALISTCITSTFSLILQIISMGTNT